MSDWGVGYAMGIAVGIAAGLAIGLIAGRKQKPWSELSDEERKIRIRLIAAGVVLLVAGVVVFLVLLLTR